MAYKTRSEDYGSRPVKLDRPEKEVANNQSKRKNNEMYRNAYVFNLN